jgi:hypothetical protein
MGVERRSGWSVLFTRDSSFVARDDDIPLFRVHHANRRDGNTTNSNPTRDAIVLFWRTDTWGAISIINIPKNTNTQ